MTGSTKQSGSRHSGFDASHRPGMTGFGLLRRFVPRNDEKSVPRGAGRVVAVAKPYSGPLPYHLDAVALFSMFTTCTRRFTSASGLAGSFSLVLPYPTVTRSVPAMPNLSTR